MDNSVNIQRANATLKTVHQLLPLVDDIENDFRSARNWGVVDVLGGGFIVDLIKHSKLDKASSKMNQMNALLNQLRNQLQSVVIPTNFNMDRDFFLTFADFCFDGALMDVYMTLKINESLKQIRALREKLEQLDDMLKRMIKQLKQ